MPSNNRRTQRGSGVMAYLPPNGLSEQDPNGINQHASGAKLDFGKNRLHLVLGGFSNALQAVSEVGTFGANKYTDNGWLTVDNGLNRYSDAMLRHYFKEQSGELIDADSELLHAAHLAWNSLARLELLISKSKSSAIGVGDND